MFHSYWTPNTFTYGAPVRVKVILELRPTNLLFERFTQIGISREHALYITLCPVGAVEWNQNLPCAYVFFFTLSEGMAVKDRGSCGNYDP